MTSTRLRGRGAGLTDIDLETLTASLAEGKRVTVFLREPTPSLGLEAGASARVLSIDGSTVTVRPKGVDDQLPFEADELRTTRLPAVAPAKAQPARTQPARVQPARTQPARTQPAKSQPAEPAVPVPPAKPVQEPVVSQEPAAAPATKAPRRPRAQPAAVSVTVTSAPDSTWTVVVSHGTKKQGKATEVTADRVARAVHELGDEGAIAAVDEIIESARVAAQRRIAELSEELESARAALAQLESR